MKTPNQIHVRRDDVRVTADDLLKFPKGDITLVPPPHTAHNPMPVPPLTLGSFCVLLLLKNGLRDNVRVCLVYLRAWLSGRGCVPINNLMEDLATAEIGRSQVAQWIRHGVKTTDGTQVTIPLALKILKEETDALRVSTPASKTPSGAADSLALAHDIFAKVIVAAPATFYDFFPTLAYQHILTLQPPFHPRF
jgi:malate synthase